jgi:transposase
LGAIHAISHELITVTNTTYINATSVIELMNRIINKYKSLPITLVLDNAKYQKCNLVIEYAEKHNIELLFLPSYSPNLNLIERLWKFVKKTCLYSKYYDAFDCFKNAILDCLLNTDKKYKKEINSLLNLKFQIFQNANL